MAERRMFSKRIINSGRFLKMPPSSQALYFHLGLAADDDGVVEAYTVMRSTGATEDDLKILCAKGFVQVLNEELVAYITDWRENNKIRADRKIDSIYKELLLRVMPEVDTLQMKNRADRAPRLPEITDGQPWDVPGTTNGQPWDGIGKDRVGEVRVGQESLGEDKGRAKRFTPPTLEEVIAYCSERGNAVDPERFIDYYESNGWKVGKNKMKDWKAAIRTWEKSEKPKRQTAETTAPRKSFSELVANMEGSDLF